MMQHQGRQLEVNERLASPCAYHQQNNLNGDDNIFLYSTNYLQDYTYRTGTTMTPGDKSMFFKFFF